MFEEIAKRIHQVAEAWQYACEAGDVVQANFHRGELSQLVSTMQSAQQSVQRTLLTRCPKCNAVTGWHHPLCEDYSPESQSG